MCSFCGKTEDDVTSLIQGPNNVYICDQCVVICGEAISHKSVPSSINQPTHKNLLTPKELHLLMGEYVVGQESAKKTLSVAVYNHLKKIYRNTHQGGVDLQKSNVLFIGPTGSGKTLLAKTLARILEIPFCICDATSLTEAGYVGEDIENILLRLIQAADYDIKEAERGIIYLDEIDKIARKSANPSITRDVSGEGVQQGLLKIIEGTIANVPPQGGRKHPQQEYIQIDTSGILFICGGSFEGIDEIIERRLSLGRHSLGFRSGNRTSDDNASTGIVNLVSTDDLLEYGFIPELIGRIPVVVPLQPLDKQSLVHVLTQPKDSLVKQYSYLFELDGVELIFDSDSLEAIAEEALSRKTGARALRTIVEEVLLDAMYEIPSRQDIQSCVVNGQTVREKKQPLMLPASEASTKCKSAEQQQIA